VTNREVWLAAAMIELADVRAPDFDEAAYAGGLATRVAELLVPAEIGLLLSGATGQLTVAAATTERARELATFEERTSEGPGTSCHRSGRACVNQSLTASAGQWPRYATAARQAGFQFVSALPLRRHAEIIGAVGILATGRPLADAEATLAQTIAEAATIGILQRRMLLRDAVKSEQLQRALDTRVVIEQAKGAVAARCGVSPAEAFELLRRYARRRNLKLADVARTAIGGELPDLDQSR
jgi:hypothetical protein